MSDGDDKPAHDCEPGQLTRRGFLAAGGSLSSLGLLLHPGIPLQAKTPARSAPQPPYDSIRDWVAALDAHGLLLRIPEVDQDAYHATGLFFQMTDKFTWWGSPALYFDRVKIDGQWVQGPVLANLQGHMSTDAIIWGLKTTGDYKIDFRQARDHVRQMYSKNNHRWPTIPPAIVDKQQAPCKQVVLRDDDIDLEKFAFLQTNPADGGRYVNSGSVVTQDGAGHTNLGTYRCQIKGPRKISLNPETTQTGYRMITEARERGDKSYPVAVVVGQDPLVFMISSTKLSGFPRPGVQTLDELSLAGGLRGKALDVVKCETNDMLVPAHAEMIIEGEVLFDEPLEPEGPFGEMYGYLGPRDPEKFWMQVTAVTHREQPWITNMFTGMERGMVSAPFFTLIEHELRERFPYLVEYYQPTDTMGITYLAINKTKAGQGLEIGRSVVKVDPMAKITVVLDDDVDLMNQQDVLRAIVSRWQPHPATHILENGRGIIIDPSQREARKTSKIAIDATRQLPEEGGPDVFAANSRDLFNELQPDAISDSEKLYAELLRRYGCRG
jgi:4-hydroxy-3-polyprenylbenzoate decarboxylase